LGLQWSGHRAKEAKWRVDSKLLEYMRVCVNALNQEMQ
jgi:hypothetical protein